jgi:hypothetical protein
MHTTILELGNAVGRILCRLILLFLDTAPTYVNLNERLRKKGQDRMKV